MEARDQVIMNALECYVINLELSDELTPLEQLELEYAKELLVEMEKLAEAKGF